MHKKITSNLPKCWSTHPALEKTPPVFEMDLKRGAVRLKVLVFSSLKGFNALHRGLLGKGGMAKGVRGFVCPLTVCVEAPGRAPEWRVDKTYFAVMALHVDWLSVEIICHESVHAGFAYAKRMGTSWDDRALDFDEEGVAYPAGEIAEHIMLSLGRHKIGLWGKK